MRTIGGRYVVESRLGEGGMGEVYRVRHIHLAKCFALKVISPTFAINSRARELFNAEAQIASEITHPNIVSVVDFGEDGEVGAYMVMELLEGEPLTVAEGSSPLSVRRALDVLAQIADALDHIHKRGIVHGDVKADNIMLVAEPAGGNRRRRIARLLDFGLARRLGTVEGELSGTPAYLAPERCTGGMPTIASDVYALGVLGYLLFTRTLPFEGTVNDILEAQARKVPEPLAKRRGEEVDEAIETLIMRAMSKQPAIRHASAAAFRYELNTVMHMLDMNPRRQSSGSLKVDRREAAAAQLFEQSLLPQAVIRADGAITLANKTFAMLIGEAEASLKGRMVLDTPLALWVPELKDALRRVRRDRQPVEHRARRYSNELVVWLTPTGVQDDVHLLVQTHSLERQLPTKPR